MKPEKHFGEENRAAQLMRGAIDTHVHAAPDMRARKLDCIALVEEGRRRGMAGVVIKDHTTLTADRASILNGLYPDFKVYGSITLNDPVGGMNPAAVEAAIGLGCRVVFMPTYGAKNQVKRWGRSSPPAGYPFSPGSEGISPIDEEGRLLPEVNEILRLVAEAGILLGTSHFSPVEILALIKGAREAGVERILVTHSSWKVIGMPLEDHLAAARMGAYLEHCFGNTRSALGEEWKTSFEEIAAHIRAVGPERCVISTDLGQVHNPAPAEGLESFLEELLARGFTPQQLARMVCQNPRNLLEE